MEKEAINGDIDITAMSDMFRFFIEGPDERTLIVLELVGIF